MRKFTKGLSLIVLILFVFNPLKVSALYANPYVLKQQAENNIINVKIYSSESRSIEAYQLNLTLTGGEIIDFAVDIKDSLKIGTCNDQHLTFTVNRICLDVVVANGISKNQLVGTLKFKLTKPVATIVADESNIFQLIENSDKYVDSGNLGIYTIKNKLAVNKPFETNTKKILALEEDKEESINHTLNNILILLIPSLGILALFLINRNSSKITQK